MKYKYHRNKVLPNQKLSVYAHPLSARFSVQLKIGLDMSATEGAFLW